MNFKRILVSLFGLVLLTSDPVHAEDVPGATKQSTDVKADIQPANADCDTKPKVKKELDPKALEQKAAEQKTLENLGLAAPAKTIQNPVVANPPAKMETCK